MSTSQAREAHGNAMETVKKVRAEVGAGDAGLKQSKAALSALLAGVDQEMARIRKKFKL